MRFSSRSCGSTLRILRLYLKVAIFQPELQEHAPRVSTEKLRFFKPELPRTRGESNPRPRDCESRRANHETTSKGHFATRRHSESASTRTISAEGSPRLRRIRTAPQRERFDTHDLRRGFIRECQKRKKPRVFAPRPRRSPQRVTYQKKNAKTLELLHLEHADPRRGSRGTAKNAKNTSSFCTSTMPTPQRVARHRKKRPKKKRVSAPRPCRSPQRVARAPQKKTYKTSSFCTSTRKRFLIPSSFSFFPAR